MMTAYVVFGVCFAAFVMLVLSMLGAVAALVRSNIRLAESIEKSVNDFQQRQMAAVDAWTTTNSAVIRHNADLVKAMQDDLSKHTLDCARWQHTIGGMLSPNGEYRTN